MESNIEYFVKLNVAFGLLYLIYRFFLSNDVRLNVRRIYLLAVMPVSILLPLIEIPVLAESEFTSNVQYFVPTFEAVQVVPEATHQASTPWNWTLLFWYLYAGIAVVQLFRMSRSVVQIVQHVKRSPLRKKGDYVFVPDSNVTLPYSFFHYIFVGLEGDNNRSTEVAHEIAHARQWHSLDRIFAEITIAFLWINPFIYFWRKALVELHEFLADRAAMVSESDWERYSKQLVSSIYQENNLQLTSNFSAHILKKRIKMITQNKKQTYWNIAILSVLLVIVAIGFACTKDIHTPKDKAIVDITKKNSADDPVFVVVEEMPQFPGGPKALFDHLSNNTTYPEQAKTEKITGRVFVRFIVSKTGEIDSITVVRKVHPLLDEEAIRVVSQMPQWKPGKQDGKEVNVWYTVPILFGVEAPKESYASPKKMNDVDEDPKFPGGRGALMKFLEERIELPEDPTNATVYVFTLMVKANGEIEGVKYDENIPEKHIKKALQIAKEMPKWIPAVKDGKNVDAWATIPYLASTK